MSIRQDLWRSITNVFKHNKEGSYATQADRRYMLKQFMNDLVSLGYGLRDIRGLKQKHILSVVNHWKTKALSNSTIKNRMSTLRNLCQKINKPTIILSNKEYNIGQRTYVPVKNKALFNPDFSRISNNNIRISLELQRVFGLRREESIKIKPYVADKKDKLELLPTWCKGGRGRTIPIITEEQRYWLDQAKKHVKEFSYSLIPQNKNYIQQRSVYDKQVLRAGLKNLHGLRHAYAQRRYKELTGWESPINGGSKKNQLTSREKLIDHQARMILTEELGHSREQITVNYCGR